jgi:hypothetical protein
VVNAAGCNLDAGCGSRQNTCSAWPVEGFTCVLYWDPAQDDRRAAKAVVLKDIAQQAVAMLRERTRSHCCHK